MIKDSRPVGWPSAVSEALNSRTLRGLRSAIKERYNDLQPAKCSEMLISLKHKFIFVANLKTASTAIEAALRDRCQVVLDRSEWGKHVSLSHIETHLASIFDFIPREQFVVFGVMRNPVDWLGSLYRSHKSIQFEGSELDTSGMSFDEFLNVWCRKNHNQVRDQHTIFENRSGHFGADYVIRYERLNDDFERLMSALGISGCNLPEENVSVDVPALDVVSRKSAAAINKRYRIDRRIMAARGGELPIINASKDFASAFEGEGDLKTSEEDYQALLSNKRATRPITRDDVTWAFRMLLGRDPESEDTVQHHLKCRTRDQLRRLIMASGEFVSIIADQQRAVSPNFDLVHKASL